MNSTIICSLLNIIILRKTTKTFSALQQAYFQLSNSHHSLAFINIAIFGTHMILFFMTLFIHHTVQRLSGVFKVGLFQPLLFNILEVISFAKNRQSKRNSPLSRKII